MKIAINKSKKGSVLVFTIMILFVLLIVAVGIASVTIVERKSSFSTDRSSSAFQIADSGVEIVLAEILKNGSRYVNDLETAGMHCDDDDENTLAVIDGSIDIPGEKTYEMTFKNEDGDNITDCDDLTDRIKFIKSIGSYNGVSRAVEVEVSLPCLGDDGLVGHWKFDDGDGVNPEPTASDETANGNDGTLEDMDNINDWVPGNDSTDSDDFALDFNTATSEVSIANDSTIQVGDGKRSISLWINPTTISPNAANLVSKGTSLNNGSSLQIDNAFNCGPGADNALIYNWACSDADVITANTWQHVVVAHDPDLNTVSFYVDGNPAGVDITTGDAADGAQNSEDINIGGSQIWEEFNGIIDDVRIYNCELTQDDVSFLYNLEGE